MNFKTTIVLLLLLIAAGVFVVVDRYRSKTEEPQPTELAGQGKKLFDVDSTDVTSLRVVPGADAATSEMELRKTDGKWEMTKPVAAAVDAFMVDSLIRQILDLRSQAQLDAHTQASVNGLEPARLNVEFSTRQGKTYKLAVGDRSPLGDVMYVRPEGDSKIEVVQADIYDTLLQPANGLRDKRLISASYAAIRHVEVDRENGKLVLDKQGSQWEVTAPEKMPADASEVTDLLGAITGLQAVDFVKPGSPEIKRAQLDHPQVVVRFSDSPATSPALSPATGASAEKPTTTTSPGTVTTITFGRYEDIRHQNVFASVSGSSDVVKVSASALKTLEQPALDFRDRKVLDLDPNEVSRLTVAIDVPAATQPTTRPSEKRTIEIVRRTETAAGEVPALIAAPGGPAPATQSAAMRKQMELFKLPVKRSSPWRIVSEPKGVADESRISSLLGALHPLRAEHYLEKFPATQSSDEEGRYVLDVKTEGPGGVPVTDYHLRFIDRGGAAMAIGEYNGLAFELPRSLLLSLQGDFTAAPKPEPNQHGGAEGAEGGEGGFPGSPDGGSPGGP